SRGHSGWAEYLEDWLPLVPVSSREDISDCKENIGGGVSRGNVSGSSGPSSWDDDSHEEPVQGNPEVATQHGNRTKALLPEDDDWDDVSVLELPAEEDKDPKGRVFVEDGLPVPVPCEAWVEGPAAGPGSRGPVPAPHRPPSPRPAQLGAQALRGQPAAPRRRPSRFRQVLWALRRLFRRPRMWPQPGE
ncbi:hypothetical protein HGM15179_022109, partial [Zosterops borbonicus]